MSVLVKVLLGLLVTLPVAAFVTVALAAPNTDLPNERAPILVPGTPPATAPAATLQPRPVPSASSPASAQNPRQTDGNQGPGGGRGAGNDIDGQQTEGARVVNPTPRAVDDDLDDRDDDDDSDDGAGDD